MADLPNPIMTATQQNDNGDEYVGKFGVEATNVQVTVSSVINNETGNAWQGNLQNYINALDNYFSNGNFMYHGTIPSGKQLPNQVKFWYDTSN